MSTVAQVMKDARTATADRARPTATPASLAGIHAAIVTPLRADFTVDEAALARMVARIMAVPGVRGILCNGHAGENTVTSRSDKAHIVSVVREAMGDGILMAGVNAEGSRAAADQARDAEAAGADAIMVFAPNGWAMGQDEHMAVTHHCIVAEATGLPLMLFQASVRAGDMAYGPAVLEELVGLPQVIGIKEGSWDTAAYEATRRLVRKLRPQIAVMASGDEHLWSSFIFGSEGSVVGLATLIPEPIVALDTAVRRGDRLAAESANEIIYPLGRAIYGARPGCLATARLKTCMRLAGLLDSDLVHPPYGPLDEIEVNTLRTAMRAAGMA